MYKDMWERLKARIKNKAMMPTDNSNNLVKHAEEIGRKQSMFDLLSEMEEMEKSYTSHQNEDDKYSL